MINITFGQILKNGAGKLNRRQITNPHLEAEILLSKILKKSHEFILTHNEYKLTKLQTANFKLLISKRLKGEPIAYLTGHKEFYSLDFKVNKDVLIPRPETELMVEEALKLVTHNSQPVTLVDVGTGSGCVIITLAKLFNSKNLKFLASDISAKALTVARQNAKRHGVTKKIKFLHGNLLEPIINNPKYIIQNTKYIILANLPYGWKEWKNNTSQDTIGLKFEPQIALYTGKNGLALYERLFRQIKKLRVASCELRDIYVLCEFDPRQTTKIKQLIKRELPQASCQIKKDLSGLNRLIIISIS